MSFSFRSLFQRDSGSPERGKNLAPAFEYPHPGMAGALPSSHPMQQASHFSQQPQASPFQVGGSPLFRTAGDEAVAAPPINASVGMSPFNVAGTASTNTPLTVGDVIGHLPPELVRAGALPLEQPLSLPPALLESVLRGGQPALPVFELYRVCPALFQTPMSPQDPRTVPLPAAKLPGLIAKAREGHANGAAAPVSPFTAHSPAGVPLERPSPFQMAQPTAAAVPSPASPAAGSSAFPMSPFAAVSPAFNGAGQGASPASSPFSIQQAVPAAGAMPPSPFTPKVEPVAAAQSPFGMSPAAAVVPSPFGMPSAATQMPAASPVSLSSESAPTPVASPFGSSLAAPAIASPSGGQGATTGGAMASPFGASLQPAQPVPQVAAGLMASPFGSPPSSMAAVGAAPASPFGASPSPVAAPPPVGISPFASPKSPMTAGTPQGSITSLFTPKPQEASAPPAAVSSFGSSFPLPTVKDAAPQISTGSLQIPVSTQSPPPVAPSMPSQAALPVFGAPSPSGSASGQAKLGFAATLYGFNADELGFNPAMVPAWITTQVPASTLKEQIASGTVIVQLGLLIDGITDVGFRNTLSAAKRDLQIKLPQNEVFHALTSSSATLPAAPVGSPGLSVPAPVQGGAPAGAFVIQPGTPAGQVTKVEPFAAAAPHNTVSPFGATPAQVSATAPASASPFATPIGAEPNPFSKPAEAAAPLAKPAAESTAFSPFMGAAAPGSNPEAGRAQVPVMPAVFPPAPATPASTPLQPIAGAFQPFGGVSAFGAQPPAVVPTTGLLAPVTKPFDPFASSSSPAGALTASAPVDSGFSSAQLLGQAPSAQAASLPAFSTPPVMDLRSTENLFPSAPAAPAKPAFVPPVFPPALEEKPATFEPSKAALAAHSSFEAPAPIPSVPLFSEPVPQPQQARVEPVVEAVPTKMPAVKHSFLGLAPLDTQTDQLLLRALLGTEENLTAPRVVELLAAQPGLSACVCLHGAHVLSHADKSTPDAAEFQRQAPEIARQLRGLAPLIGIDGAETFTLNAGGRLLTFCFPAGTTVGVLHVTEPSNGLRDKITLIARELSRMLG